MKKLILLPLFFIAVLPFNSWSKEPTVTTCDKWLSKCQNGSLSYSHIPQIVEALTQYSECSNQNGPPPKDLNNVQCTEQIEKLKKAWALGRKSCIDCVSPHSVYKDCPGYEENAKPYFACLPAFKSD